MLLDKYIPRYDFTEVHTIMWEEISYNNRS